MEHLSSSYLYAIQEIPGETREEKLKSIGQIVKRIIDVIEDTSDFPSAIKQQNVPNALVPSVKVLVGVKIKSPAFIIEALQSDDIYLVFEALRARWFFDGSDKTITSFEYFSAEVLPFVSMSTRRKIVKKLAVCLGDKQTEIAENFFNGFVNHYGVQEATNFLPACRSDFIYQAVIQHKIVLSNKILRILYRKYPDLALKYLKFVNPYELRDEIGRTMFRIIDINEYENFMPLLITRHPEVFVSMQEVCRTSPNLGNRRTLLFLKNAKHLLIKKPRDIIDLMPIKLVYDHLKEEEFEEMFGNVLEDRWDMFYIDDTLNYLEYYPKEKRASLIKRKVKERYGHDLLDKVDKITIKFLLLLPQEERYDLTRKIVNDRHKVMEGYDTDTSWWCYLPVEEAIPALKLQIAKNWKSAKRQKFFSQLIYVCKLNENKEALLDVLRFVDEKYKNERSDVICSMLDRITQEFDLDTFTEEYWTLLFSIIKRIKLKKANARDYWVLIKILKKNVHYCYSHNLPAAEIIDWIVQLFVEGRVGVSWKLLEDDAKYERLYLDICFKHEYWSTMDYKKNYVEGIYNFNERHVTDKNGVERLSIKNYPHLLTLVEETIKKEQNEGLSWIIYTKEKLKKHEPELYDSWFALPSGNQEPEEEDVHMETENSDNEDDESSGDKEKSVIEVKEKVIYLTEAIIALKRNYSEIKENWPRYYECCKNELSSKKRYRVRNFLKALRWYQDVPIKFAERSIEEKNFNVIGHLFDGTTYSKIAQNFLPKEDEQDHSNSYVHAVQIIAAMRNPSPPIPVDLVQNYLTKHFMYSFKNYINDGLKLWSYVAYRTSADKMIVMARTLASDRFFMKRHAIRLMSSMAARDDLVKFYRHMWSSEEHLMVRQMLAERIGKLFAKRPSEGTWALMSICISDLSAAEDDILEDLMGTKAVPVEFASQYAERIFQKVKELTQKGMPNNTALKLLEQLFENLKPDCKDSLSEEFYREILSYYLRNIDVEISNADKFVVKVYLNPTSMYFEERLKHLSDWLLVESKRWYGLSIDKRKLSLNFVNKFIEVVVYQVLKFKGSLKLVENLYNIISSIFTPYQHTWSHIMLFLCVEFMRAEPSFRNFGVRVSEKIDVLVEKFSPLYFMQIVEMIREFICNFSFYEYSSTVKNRLNFLEGLIETKNVHALIVAAKLLNQKIVSEYDGQHCKILKQLTAVDNPIVQSFLY